METSSIQCSSITPQQEHNNKPEHTSQHHEQIKEAKQAQNIEKEQFDSQFLELDPEIMKKLQRIEQSKTKPVDTKQKSLKSYTTLPKILTPEQQRAQQAVIKKQFVHKLKQWDRQKQQLKIRRQQAESKKSKQKQSINLRKKQEEEQEKQFLKLQKQKVIQQKIQQIEERRQKRQQSLKNALLKRSYNKLPSYAETEQKYQQFQQEAVEVNIRLIKDKKKLAQLDPQQLKLHQQAYIQRIKERLNMVPRADRSEKAKSDFNLYLKRSEEKKRQDLNKIIKMKKYQEKINSIPIKIDESKKEQKLIEIDKIKNPQKYRLLSQKLLNDQQIYEEFKHFSINIDRKQLGTNYLNELKQAHQKPVQKVRKANSQMLKSNPEQKLPTIINKRHEFQAKSTMKHHQKTKSVQLLPSDAYRQSLDKNRERDSRYMKAIRQKLAMAVDM